MNRSNEQPAPPALRALLRTARLAVRVLQTRRESVPLPMRLALGSMLVLVFAPLWASLRAWARIRGPVRQEARTAFGARFVCRLPDMIQTYLWLFGTWEPDITSFVARRLGPGDSFIDVGANVGYFSLLAAGRVGPRGRVVAIEPSPRIFQALQENLALNQPACPMRAVSIAVADVEGEIELYAGPPHNLGLTSTHRHRNMRPEGTVRAAPLDRVLAENELGTAKLIKIDVEGGEDSVLAGMSRCIDRLRPDAEVIIELSPAWWRDRGRTPEDVLAPFIEAGFHIYEIPNDYWPWRYLWPMCVARPRRLTSGLDRRIERLDLVLSRVNAEAL